ncbi:ketopantoate reductase family protein [Konateibacter massiliensis]|uniref:ketopantoate reductase family protein n=1 Tax=Konateibacter massiliensis TaxID=2002841 RepID=UPI000C15826B|nr:2-dehydropantoate 2-reductase [Konateibacter massiliensis]
MSMEKVALIGSGAVGGVYAKYLHLTYGDKFYVVANKSRRERLEKQGLRVNGIVFKPRLISSEEETKMDLIIFAVKNYDLEQAIADVKNLVKDGTIMLPLLNGITASDRIREAYPTARTLLGLSMGIDALRTEDGIVNTDDGVVQLGYEDNTVISGEVAEVDEYLRNAGICSKVFPDMKRMLWRKWMLNVGVNQASAVAEAKFKYFGQNKELLTLFRSAMLEVLAIAEACKVNLTMEDVDQIEEVIVNFTPEGKTSMLQDIEAKRRTEIDYFAGTVIEYGKKTGVPTPVNDTLYLALKAKEDIYLKES